MTPPPAISDALADGDVAHFDTAARSTMQARGLVSIRIDALPLTRWLWAATLTVLAVGGIRSLLVQAGVITGDMFGEFRVVNLDAEQSIPAWYGSMLMWTAAGLLALSAMAARATGRGSGAAWWILAAIFVGLSLDEAVSIHEATGQLLPDSVEQTGLLLHGWVVVAAPFLLIGGVAFLPFLARLPRETRLSIVFAAFLYVLGAFGLELVDGYLVSIDAHDWFYLADVFVEEGLELIGLSLFITGILGLLVSDGLAVKIGRRS